MSSERVFTSPPDLLVTNFSILCFSTSFTYWLNQLHLHKCRITFQAMSLSTQSGQPDVLPEALPLGGFTPPLRFWATSKRTVVLTPSTFCFPSIPILLILRNASGSHGSREKKEIGAGSIWPGQCIHAFQTCSDSVLHLPFCIWQGNVIMYVPFYDLIHQIIPCSGSQFRVYCLLVSVVDYAGQQSLSLSPIEW